MVVARLPKIRIKERMLRFALKLSFQQSEREVNAFMEIGG